MLKYMVIVASGPTKIHSGTHPNVYFGRKHIHQNTGKNFVLINAYKKQLPLLLSSRKITLEDILTDKT